MSLNMDSARLFQAMTDSATTVMEIEIDQVRTNPLNIYRENSAEEESIIALANNISIYGQLEACTVYYDDSIDDGKKYTLIGGERRYRAIQYLQMQTICVSIISKPETQLEEELLLISDNMHRDLEPQERTELNKKLVNKLNARYEELCEQGNRPKGKRREWISTFLSIRPRQVQEYLTGHLSDEPTPESHEEEQSQSNALNELTSSDKEYVKTVAKNMNEEIERNLKIKVKGKNVTLSVTTEYDDLPTLLQIFGFDENGLYVG